MGAFREELKVMSGDTIHGKPYFPTYEEFLEEDFEVCIKCNQKEFVGGWCNNCHSRNNKIYKIKVGSQI
jgi:hypothetical protein